MNICGSERAWAYRSDPKALRVIYSLSIHACKHNSKILYRIWGTVLNKKLMNYMCNIFQANLINAM